MAYGMVKVGALSPRVTVGNPIKNEAAALESILEAERAGVAIAVLPELFLSGYTCADLFHQDALIEACENSLALLMRETAGCAIAVAVGLPVRVGDALYNCAALFQKGRLLGVVPKEYIPNYQEFYEKRWFHSGTATSIREITLADQLTSFGRILFRLGDEAVVGIEICEDLWVPIPPSARMALSGANLILNLSASNEVVTKNEYRQSLVTSHSGKCMCGYVYASAGAGESTTDVVFSGACTIAEDGALLAEGERFARAGSCAYACIDLWKLAAERRKTGTFQDSAKCEAGEYTIVEGALRLCPQEQIDRVFDPFPFVPQDSAVRKERCAEILEIQAAGLCKRLEHIGLKKMVVGISGGLDSTLALLVMHKAAQILELPASSLLCVTMPGFGTTDRTYENALELIFSMGAQLREVDIRPACLQHMKDIGHDPSVHDITYENTQARERTQILMDLANKEDALLVGTGDLSELALGWCTYNGDHMSMYGVNASVPKTLVRYLVAYSAECFGGRTADVLERVLETPVSPELLPPDENGQILQKTEEKIGPYELHDFFLYHFLRFGTKPDKLCFMALRAFAGRYGEDEIRKWLKLFLKRFFQSQFKRSCMPDGPKVGSVSLSPRGDWRMPSDGDGTLWQEITWDANN